MGRRAAKYAFPKSTTFNTFYLTHRRCFMLTCRFAKNRVTREKRAKDGGKATGLETYIKEAIFDGVRSFMDRSVQKGQNIRYAHGQW